MTEPAITVNGKSLTEAQAMAVRVAVTDFQSRMSEKDALGSGSVGEGIRRGYQERAGEVVRIMLPPAPSPHVAPAGDREADIADIQRLATMVDKVFVPFPPSAPNVEWGDWTVDDTDAAREIMNYLGYGSDASREPGADRRRDKIAGMIRARIDAATAPAPGNHVAPTTSTWQWWAGSDEEWCTVGPEDTREAIIQAATNDSLGEFEHEGGGWNLGFYIVEARQDPLRLADWIEADRLLERAEEGISDSDRVSSEYDDGPWFECTPEQEKDLEERVKRACDEWQAAHRLVFSCATFSHTRNREHVIVELPDDRATTEDSDNA